MDFDVIVIGGGPAGAMAARAAATQARVLLIDEKFTSAPPPPACAEGMGDAVLKALDIPEEKMWITNRVDKIRIVSPSRKERTVELKHLTALMLDRPAFEQWLINQAVKEGATFEQGRRVTQVDFDGEEVAVRVNDLQLINGDVRKTEGYEIFTSKLVIDCSGMNGIAAKAAGLHTRLKPSDIGVCTQYQCFSPIEENQIELWFGASGFAPTGYTWIFPKGDYENIGMGVQGGHGFNTDEMLSKFICSRFDSIIAWHKTKACLPLAPPLQQVSTKQCLVAGDAARFCIATTGAGIGMALFSGRMAGAIAGSNIQGHIHLGRYDEVMHQTIIPKLSGAYQLKEKFCKNDLTMERYFKVLRPLLWLHDIFPKWSEKYAARNMRFA